MREVDSGGVDKAIDWAKGSSESGATLVDAIHPRHKLPSSGYIELIGRCSEQYRLKSVPSWLRTPSPY